MEVDLVESVWLEADAIGMRAMSDPWELVERLIPWVLESPAGASDFLEAFLVVYCNSVYTIAILTSLALDPLSRNHHDEMSRKVIEVSIHEVHFTIFITSFSKNLCPFHASCIAIVKELVVFSSFRTKFFQEAERKYATWGIYIVGVVTKSKAEIRVILVVERLNIRLRWPAWQSWVVHRTKVELIFDEVTHGGVGVGSFTLIDNVFQVIVRIQLKSIVELNLLLLFKKHLHAIVVIDRAGNSGGN